VSIFYKNELAFIPYFTVYNKQTSVKIIAITGKLLKTKLTSAVVL
jgi:hypothetical protein